MSRSNKSDIRSINAAVNEFKTKIETKAIHIGNMNSTIRDINTRFTSFDWRVTVLEEMSDYTSDISTKNDSIVNLQKQIDVISIPDYTSDIRNLNSREAAVQDKINGLIIQVR